MAVLPFQELVFLHEELFHFPLPNAENDVGTFFEHSYNTSMIIFINGSFGVGKSSIGERLITRVSNNGRYAFVEVTSPLLCTS